jgi:hydroxymethylpyrimidine pyrophosphatase-like HAD family hydrolase
MIIAVDFDGTIVEHQFPEIGKMLPFAANAIKALKEEGHKLILWTCRNDIDPANNGRLILTEAVEFLKDQGIEFDAINGNIPGLGINPRPKVYADLYIDDRMYNANINWEYIMYHSGLTKYKPKEELILDFFKTTGIDIQLKTKKREVSEMRMICMYVMRRNTSLSYKEIGLKCGNKDHATAYHAFKTVPDLMLDKKFRFKYEPIFNHFNL